MTRYLLLSLALIGLLLPGCMRRTVTTKAPPPVVATAPPVQVAKGENPPPPQPPKGGVVQGGIDLKRTIQKADAMNQLKNIALSYVQYNLENGKSPDSQKALMEYVKSSSPKEYKSLEEGYFTIVPKAQTRGDVVIGYEQNGDSSGNHFVAYGDGRVEKMATDNLKTALGMK